MNYRTLLFDSAADYLLSANAELAGAAAAFMWRGYSHDNFRNLLSILSDPAYKNRGRALDCLRRHCPSEHQGVIEQM